MCTLKRYTALKNEYNDFILAKEEKETVDARTNVTAQKALLDSFTEKSKTHKDELEKLKQYCDHLKKEYEELLDKQEDEHIRDKIYLDGNIQRTKLEIETEKSKAKGQVLAAI